MTDLPDDRLPADEELDGAQPSDYLLKEIERDLCDDEELSELHVRLSVRSGRLFVQGQVTSARSRDAVLGLVGERCPDCTVVDELTVAEDALSLAPTHSEVIR
jgi:hypothetical protein